VTPIILSESTYGNGVDYAAQHVLQGCACEKYPPPTNYWLAPDHTLGVFVVDFGSKTKISGVKLRNAGNVHNPYGNDR
jgi:hypothetical protein